MLGKRSQEQQREAAFLFGREIPERCDVCNADPPSTALVVRTTAAMVQAGDPDVPTRFVCPGCLWSWVQRTHPLRVKRAELYAVSPQAEG